MIFDLLRGMPAFASYSDKQLAGVARVGRTIQFPANHVVLTENSTDSGLYVLLEGEFEMIKRIRSQDVVLSRHQPGDFAGEITLFTGAPQPATIRTTRPSQFLYFEAALFDEFKASPMAAPVISMARRMSSMEALVYQQDKLTALGKMAAGMAHELNNPAAANLRAAEHLQDTLGELQILSLRFVELDFTPEQVRYLFNFARGRLRNAPPAGDPLALSDREEALNTWLAGKNLGAAWQLAGTLAAVGVEIQDLEDFQAHFSGEQLQLALAYAHNFLTANTLLSTLQRSTDKIAELVNAVKGYAYMDQAPRQEIDVHTGLENTLVMFSHRLKNVRVIRDYDRSLPQITAYGSELNQVWTNLIDNALDAMHENGELHLRTYREVDSLVVEISDTGQGIPEELQARIFEPFFTSKAPGKGTGLGLDIAYRIVTERHGGHMQFTSAPGHTTFKICLPLEAETGKD